MAKAKLSTQGRSSTYRLNLIHADRRLLIDLFLTKIGYLCEHAPAKLPKRLAAFTESGSTDDLHPLHLKATTTLAGVVA
jgi:hypothetical protein